MLSFIGYLKSMLWSANAVAVVTFPPSLLSETFCKRLQHMADILLSVKAIPGFTCAIALFKSIVIQTSNQRFSWFLLDDDKELAKLLTGYQDMVGFLNVYKVARINTQVLF